MSQRIPEKQKTLRRNSSREASKSGCLRRQTQLQTKLVEQIALQLDGITIQAA